MPPSHCNWKNPGLKAGMSIYASFVYLVRLSFSFCFLDLFILLYLYECFTFVHVCVPCVSVGSPGTRIVDG